MFATIRKHQTWLWFVIVTITIVSFVILGPTNTRMGNALSRQNATYGMVGGKPITIDQLRNARAEVMLGAFLKTQQWPTEMNSLEMTRETYIRLFMLQKAKELGISSSIDAVAMNVKRILGSGAIDDFEAKVLLPEGLHTADFERFVRNQLNIEQMIRTAGTPGKLVTPQEAETMFRLENQEVDAQLVYLHATNYTAGVSVTPDILSQFYTNQLANYREADKVRVEYVKFEATNYYTTAEAGFSNLTQRVDNEVRILGTNYFGKAKTAEESRAAIRKAFINEAAVIEARRAASEFSKTLDGLPHTLDSFHALALTNKLTVGTTRPFERKYGPTEVGLNVPLEFAQIAFSMSADDIFSPSIVAEDGVYVAAFKERIPSRTPPLEEIKARLEEDYRYAVALQVAQQTAGALSTALTNGLTAGKSFSAICAQSGAKPISLPPLSLSTREVGEDIEHGIDLGFLKQVVFSTPVGSASAPANARDGAFLVYVNKQLPMDEAKLKAELPGFIAYIRQARNNDAFNMWFNAEIKKDPGFLQGFQQIVDSIQGKNGSSRRPSS